MDIEFVAKSVNITASNSKEVTISASVNEGDVLDNFSIKDILNYYDADLFLDEIGREECIKKFDIEEA